METKWHNKDKVWWANTLYYTVFEMRIFQTIIIQVDNDIIVRYRLNTPASYDAEKITPYDVEMLKDELLIDDKVLFATKDEAYEYLFKYMKEEAENDRKQCSIVY